jgi:hypothetical protein
LGPYDLIKMFYIRFIFFEIVGFEVDDLYNFSQKKRNIFFSNCQLRTQLFQKYKSNFIKIIYPFLLTNFNLIANNNLNN